ncbi:MAG: hypothetical protein WA194_03235 [Patescibacteria group bacterium]
MSERTDENVSYEILGEGTFEFFVDEGLFSKEVVMKALYPYLDTCYFFLRRTEGGITVRCDLHDKGKDVGPAAMAGILSGAILDGYLRERVTSENKDIREKLVTTALEHSLRQAMVVEDGDDFRTITNSGKSIDEILKELEMEFDIQK